MTTRRTLATVVALGLAGCQAGRTDEPSPRAPSEPEPASARFERDMVRRFRRGVRRLPPVGNRSAVGGPLGDSAAAWRAGVDVLAATPLPLSVLDGKRAALARRLQELAARSRGGADGVDDPAERARAYRERLVVCATCHLAGAAR